MHSSRRRISRKSRVLQSLILTALPIEVVQKLVANLTWEEFVALLAVQKRHKDVMLDSISTLGSAIQLQIHFDAEVDSPCLDTGGPPSSCPGSPLRVAFSVPQETEVGNYLLEQLLMLLPSVYRCSTRAKVEVLSIRGLTSLENIETLKNWPLRVLELASLDEDDVDLLCSLLRSLQGSLRALHIHNFCRDRPTPENLAHILAALPPGCTELDVRHVLPLAQAFASMPSFVTKLGTIVLMDQVFYYSRSVGMTISRFQTSFPRLTEIQELCITIGPGHYEEPTWLQSGSQFVDILRTKFPSLCHLYIEAKVESSSNPPLISIIQALQEHGIVVAICKVQTCSGRWKQGDAVRKLKEVNCQWGSFMGSF